MVIYGDILFVFNMIVDYILLSVTALILKDKMGAVRQIISATIGGLSAFYIFWDSKSVLIDILFKLLISYVMMLITFGIRRPKKCLIGALVFVAVSFFLSGIADFFATTFSLNILNVNNGYIYIGISPIMLISLSTVFYLLFRVIFRINKNKTTVERCRLDICINNRCKSFNGLIDSGNMLSDILSDSEIFIVSSKVVSELCGMSIDEFFEKEENKKRCRLIPAATVGGESCFYAIRCDKAVIEVENKKIEVSKPIIAVSKYIDKYSYDVIIPKGATEGVCQ